MYSLMTWIGKLIGTVMVGPGAVVLGDPGLDVEPATKPWSPMTYRVIGLVLALTVLAIGGVPLPVLGIIGLVVAGLIGLERLWVSRKRD